MGDSAQEVLGPRKVTKHRDGGIDVYTVSLGLLNSILSKYDVEVASSWVVRMTDRPEDKRHMLDLRTRRTRVAPDKDMMETSAAAAADLKRGLESALDVYVYDWNTGSMNFNAVFPGRVDVVQ